MKGLSLLPSSYALDASFDGLSLVHLEGFRVDIEEFRGYIGFWLFNSFHLSVALTVREECYPHLICLVVSPSLWDSLWHDRCEVLVQPNSGPHVVVLSPEVVAFLMGDIRLLARRF